MPASNAARIVLPHRRDFVKATGATLAGVAASQAFLTRSAYAAGDDVLRIGLVGCGGRGTGAAANALQADPNVRLTALGDMFADRLQSSLETLKKSPDLEKKVGVVPEKCFTGIDAYKQVIDSGVDVVLLCTPPHFRPAQLKYAVQQGKHVFAEKPVAVDGPGVRSCLETVAEAKRKGLSVVNGLCWRYDPGKRETVARIHDGAIGEVRAIQVSYNTGSLWMKPRQPEWSDMEWQLRNWLYFAWLSGDHNVEQHVHSLDKGAWIMHDEPPVKCIGLGGRQVRTGPEYGHIFDHHAVVYDFANGAKMFSFCRQQAGCAPEVADTVIGSTGVATLLPRDTIKGERVVVKPGNMYQIEHNELFASIRKGTPINNGDYMVRSSLIATMARMATYTGPVVTWDQALNSQEDLTPPSYALGPLPTPPVALPGVTRFA